MIHDDLMKEPVRATAKRSAGAALYSSALPPPLQHAFPELAVHTSYLHTSYLHTEPVTLSLPCEYSSCPLTHLLQCSPRAVIVNVNVYMPLPAHTTCATAHARKQPGDCVVAFSKRDIFAIRQRIEKSTGLKCCVVYGALPPETRSQQAKLFNNSGTGYVHLHYLDSLLMCSSVQQLLCV